MLFEEEIVGVRAVDPANLVDVAKAFGGQERGAGTLPFKQRIDCNGRPMKEKARFGEGAARPVDDVADSLDQPRRRRQRLAEAEHARCGVERGDVRERTSDVRGDTQPCPVAFYGNVGHDTLTLAASTT